MASSVAKRLRRFSESAALKKETAQTARYRIKKHSDHCWSATVVGPFYGIGDMPTMYGSTVFVHRMGLTSAAYREILKERMRKLLLAQFGYRGRLLHSSIDEADFIPKLIRGFSSLNYRPENLLSTDALLARAIETRAITENERRDTNTRREGLIDLINRLR